MMVEFARMRGTVPTWNGIVGDSAPRMMYLPAPLAAVPTLAYTAVPAVPAVISPNSITVVGEMVWPASVQPAPVRCTATRA